jgi:site-specific DNA-methyltransferase (cytosine-N4-specific)
MPLDTHARALLPSPETVQHRIKRRSADDPRYWDFSGVRQRAGMHGLFNYPAMMVPELQGALLDDVLKVHGRETLVYDPFMGAGTVLLESRYRGLSFEGSDINPLAVLVSAVKAAPPSAPACTDAIDAVVGRTRQYRSHKALEFLHRDKWFTAAAARDLTRLRRAIAETDDLGVRRFLWVCLAETVRLVSNSRMSTFKLHIYSPADLAAREPEAVSVFSAVGAANVLRVAADASRVSTIDPAPVRVRCAAVTNEDSAPDRLADILMTSPPYGDNHTTVPYGQHSYLPLCWIDWDDLPGQPDAGLLATSQTLDTASLGGSRAVRADVIQRVLRDNPSVTEMLGQLVKMPTLAAKVSWFVDDYANALACVAGRLRPGGYSLWTLGERRVNGSPLPLVALTREVLESQGHRYVASVTRKVCGKRMASRNRSGSTMTTEQILVMQRANR